MFFLLQSWFCLVHIQVELRQMVKEEHERLDKEKSASSKKKTSKSGQDHIDKSLNKSANKSPKM
jgi:hypothetical protein